MESSGPNRNALILEFLLHSSAIDEASVDDDRASNATPMFEHEGVRAHPDQESSEDSESSEDPQSSVSDIEPSSFNKGV